MRTHFTCTHTHTCEHIISRCAHDTRSPIICALVRHLLMWNDIQSSSWQATNRSIPKRSFFAFKFKKKKKQVCEKHAAWFKLIYIKEDLNIFILPKNVISCNIKFSNNFYFIIGFELSRIESAQKKIFRHEIRLDILIPWMEEGSFGRSKNKLRTANQLRAIKLIFILHWTWNHSGTFSIVSEQHARASFYLSAWITCIFVSIFFAYIQSVIIILLRF